MGVHVIPDQTEVLGWETQHRATECTQVLISKWLYLSFKGQQLGLRGPAMKIEMSHSEILLGILFFCHLATFQMGLVAAVLETADRSHGHH